MIDWLKCRAEEVRPRLARVLAAIGWTIAATILLSSCQRPEAGPCGDLFDHSVAGLQEMTEAVAAAGALYFKETELQQLATDSAQAADDLGQCCKFFQVQSITPDEFLECQRSFNEYRQQLERLLATVDGIREAEQKNQAQPIGRKEGRLAAVWKALEATSQKLNSTIRFWSERSSKIEQMQSALSQMSMMVEIEPNDRFQEATAIRLGVLNGGLSGDEDLDFFQIEVHPGDILALDFTPGSKSGAQKISLYDAERNEIWGGDAVAPGSTRSERLLLDSMSSGSHFLQISGAAGDYELIVSLSTQNDGGFATDAGNLFSSALDIQPGQAVPGELGGMDEEDWYRFEVSAGVVLTVSCRPADSAGSIRCALYDFDKREIWDSGDAPAGTLKSKKVLMNSNSGGIYFLRAYRGSGQYEISAGVTPQDDAASGQDAADRMSKARDIDGTQSVAGEIGGFDEEDWYRMTIPAGHVLYLVVSQDIGGGTIQATVTDSAAREIWHSGDIAPGASQPARLIMNSSSGGAYYLRIHAGSGAYRLETFIQSQNDGNSGTDAGDRMADALPIASLRAFSGELGGFDEQDWYALSPQAGNRIRFIVDSEASVMKLSFHNPERDEGWYAAEVAPGMSRSVQIPAQIAPPYYLKVHGAHGQYTLEIQ